MHRDVVNAVAHFGVRIGNVFRVQSFIDRFPRRAAVISAKRTRRGDGNDYAIAVFGIQDDGMQTHAARAWLPLRSSSVTAQTRKLLPRLAAVGRTKQRRVFNAGVDGVGVVERRLEMPNSFELPRMRRAVVKLMRRERFTGFFLGVVNKLIALAFRHSVRRGRGLADGRSGLKPRLAAIV